MVSMMASVAAQDIEPETPGDAAGPGPTAYSPDVERKAEDILRTAGFGLGRDRYSAVKVGDIGKQFSGLVRQRRQITVLHRQRDDAVGRLEAVKQNLRMLRDVQGKLSLQLAAVRDGDVVGNNRIVGRLAANKLAINQMKTNRTRAETVVDAARSAVHEAEADYSRQIVELRQQLVAITDELDRVMNTAAVQTAFRVLQTNRGTTPPVVSELTQSVERRLSKLEQQVHREAIPLDRRSNNLVANVIIGSVTIPMIVDTGASLVCLTTADAERIGLRRDQSAEPIRLRMADGREIAGHRVVLPSVRVGTFEATNVEAAVLGPEAVAAQPLLGMTYLGQFRSEIDSAAATLRMTRVE